MNQKQRLRCLAKREARPSISASESESESRSESESAPGIGPRPRPRDVVFGVAVALDGAVVAIAHKAGRGHAWLADQAMRASASAVLNLAEALGRESADRARALRIARGSALELDAALTLMLHRGACRAKERKAAKALTVRVVAMLTALRNRAAP